MRIEWIFDPAALDALEGPWLALEQAVGHRTHLSSFDFLAAWYRHYAGDYGGTPLIGLAWEGSALAGVAPLTLRRGSVGRIPVDRVEFAPSDVPAGEFLVEERRPEIIDAFVDSLKKRGGFDVICLEGLESSSPHLAALRRAAARHGMPVEADEHASAIVDLRRGYGSYVAALSAHYRRNLNQKARKIDAAGARVGGVHLTASPGAIEEAIGRLISINEASYKLNGQRLADHHRGFLADVVRRLGRRGTLSLPILSIGGRDAAFMLGVIERGCFYDITLAYDESFAKLSPGAFLTQKVLEMLPDEGVQTMVSHGAHEYKKHWATRFVPQQRVFLFAPGVRGRAARFVRFGLHPLWKRLAGFTLVGRALSGSPAQT